MKKEIIISSIVSVFFSVLIMGTCAYVFSWSEPEGTMPGDYDLTPINTTDSFQYKKGEIGAVLFRDVLADGTDTGYYLNPNANSKLGGNLEVGGSFYYGGGDGDVNDDGNTDSNDSMFIEQYLLGLREMTKEQYATADIDGDGKITSIDSQLMMHVGVGNYTIEEAHFVGKQISNKAIGLDYDGNVKIQNSLSGKDDVLSVAGKIYSDNDICIASGACLSDLDDFIGAQPLVNSQHTYTDCTDAGGEVVDTDVSYPQCRFSNNAGVSCPSGWNQYKHYCETIEQTICWSDYIHNISCVNVQEWCPLGTSYPGSCSQCWVAKAENPYTWRDQQPITCTTYGTGSYLGYNPTVTNIITKIGCY